MDKYKKLIKDALRDSNSVCHRQANHAFWILPGGKTITFSATPSDRRSLQNSWSELRKLLNLVGERGVEGVRVKKSLARVQATSAPAILGSGSLSQLSSELSRCAPAPIKALPVCKIQHPVARLKPAREEPVGSVNLDCLKERFPASKIKSVLPGNTKL